MNERDEKLLEAICNYNTLPKEQQERLRPLLQETIQRHKEQKEYSKMFELVYLGRSD